MRDILSASETATRTRVLSALAALLLCAGLGQAQERGDGAAAGTRRPAFNVKPFEDLALEGKLLVEQGKFGPETALDVSATAELAEDGRLRPESVSIAWHRQPSDPVAEMMARKVIAALSESRVLSAVEGATAVRFALRLDRQNVSVTAACEMPAESEAEKYAQGYGLLLKAATISRSGTDEGQLYNRLGFSSEGKTFKMFFEMPRAEAARIIADMLARKAAKAAASRN